MDILSRRLYNGGFNHLRRRTSSLILGVPHLVEEVGRLVGVAVEAMHRNSYQDSGLGLPGEHLCA